MPSKRNSRGNLHTFNEQRSVHVLPLLERELALCRRRKLEFKTSGLLALYLADKVQVDRSTLTRNPKYNKFLLEYIAGQPGAVTRTPDTTTDPAILQAKLAAAKIESANQTSRLREAVAQLERLTGETTYGPRVDQGGEVQFANLAMVLVIIMNRFPDFLQIDRGKRELIDLSAKPSDRVVAAKERMGAFIQWLEANHSLPLVRTILDQTLK